MKVLVATHEYSGHGAAVMLLAVLKHWIRDLGWTVDVLLDLDREVPPDLASVGANIFSEAIPTEYDVALVNTVMMPRYIETLSPQVPTVLWVHEGETVLWSWQLTPAQWRNLFRLPARIIFQGPWQSEGVFRSFLTGLPRGIVSCVRNGLPELPPDLIAKPKTPGKARVVFVGGVYGRKRPQDLVEAVLSLGRDDVECLFVGPIEGIATIGADAVAKIQSHPDCFKLLGELDRKTGLEYVMSADVFCLPSGDESQPLAPLEAAALGVPCLLTDLEPYADTWRHGVNCLLNPAGDWHTLRSNLRTVLDDKVVREQVTKRALELPSRFSMGAFFKRFNAELPI